MELREGERSEERNEIERERGKNRDEEREKL